MTAEGRTTLGVVAVAVSVAVHVLLMEFMAPRVMNATTTPKRAFHSNRRVVAVREEAPPVETFDPPPADVPAPRPDPKPKEMPSDQPLADVPAEADAAPSADVAAAMASPAPTPEMPLPQAAEPSSSIKDAANSMAKPKVLTYSASEFEISELTTSSAGPIASAGSSAPPASAPPQASAAAVEAPSAPPPAPSAAFTPPPEAPVASALTIERTEEPAKSSYVFENKVFEDVDEKTVEAEKAAVRDLLEAPAAKPLPPDVSCEFSQGIDPANPAWRIFRIAFTVREDSMLPVVPKDTVILIDASGSIANDRLKSCRDVAKQMLRTCSNSGDRFNLVAFRDKFTYAFDGWRPCDAPSYEAADRWLGRLAAHGRTDVFASIRSVLTLPRDPERPLIALVVTDGDANSGVYRTEDILSKFTALNGGLVSVYMYGVKSSANRKLIDLLTHGNRGESFIHEGFRWRAGAGLEGLAKTFRDPVFTDVSVTFATASEVEAYPRYLRNLCKGRTVELYGRCPASKDELVFSLRALSGSDNRESMYKLPLSGTAKSPDLAAHFAAERSKAL